MNRRDKSIWKRLGGLGRPGETGRTGRIPEGCTGRLPDERLGWTRWILGWTRRILEGRLYEYLIWITHPTNVSSRDFIICQVARRIA